MLNCAVLRWDGKVESRKASLRVQRRATLADGCEPLNLRAPTVSSGIRSSIAGSEYQHTAGLQSPRASEPTSFNSAVHEATSCRLKQLMLSRGCMPAG